MSTKRANGEGTIRQRADGRWEAQFVAGHKPDGRPIRRSIYAKTQAMVNERLLDVRGELREGLYVEPSQLTAGAWLDTWLDQYVRPTKRKNTILTYENSIRKHLQPAFGSIRLQKLRTEHVQAALNLMIASGFKSATIAKARCVISGALKQAVSNRLIARNAADAVVLPRQEQEEISPLTPDEQRLFLAALADNTMARAFEFILRTGLRVSEMCGLRWSDVESDLFHVRQALGRLPNDDAALPSKTSIQASEPKTRAGRRRIPLSAKARAVLDAQRRQQRVARAKAGPSWQENNLVFCTERGRPLDARNISRELHRLLDEIGAPRRGVHALRHTFATRAIAGGMDVRTLSELLGHSDVATTLRLYVHSSMETKRRAMAAIDELI